MGKRGPQKKPTTLKVLHNKRARVDPDEPMPDVLLPKAPKHLSRAAKGIWRRLGKILVKHNLLTENDEVPFGTLCQTYADIIEIENKLRRWEKEGTSRYNEKTGAPKLIVYHLVNLRKEAKQLGAIFGMGASYRAGLKIKPPKKSSKLDQWKKKKEQRK